MKFETVQAVIRDLIVFTRWQKIFQPIKDTQMV